MKDKIIKLSMTVQKKKYTLNTMIQVGLGDTITRHFKKKNNNEY